MLWSDEATVLCIEIGSNSLVVKHLDFYYYFTTNGICRKENQDAEWRVLDSGSSLPVLQSLFYDYEFRFK